MLERRNSSYILDSKLLQPPVQVLHSRWASETTLFHVTKSSNICRQSQRQRTCRSAPILKMVLETRRKLPRKRSGLQHKPESSAVRSKTRRVGQTNPFMSLVSLSIESALQLLLLDRFHIYLR